MAKPSQYQPPANEIRENRRMDGKIVRLNKGFGFLEGEDGRDYFFHWTEIDKFSRQFRNLRIGEEISFQPGSTDEGPRAFAIKTKDVNRGCDVGRDEGSIGQGAQ